ALPRAVLRVREHEPALAPPAGVGVGEGVARRDRGLDAREEVAEVVAEILDDAEALSDGGAARGLVARLEGGRLAARDDGVEGGGDGEAEGFEVAPRGGLLVGAAVREVDHRDAEAVGGAREGERAGDRRCGLLLDPRLPRVA